MKPTYNAAVTTVPIVLTENSPGSKPKFGSCHSQEGDFSEIQENSHFHIKPAQRQDKFRNIQRVPIENRANFKNENLEEKPQNYHLLTKPGFKVVLKTTVILKVLKSVACKKNQITFSILIS